MKLSDLIVGLNVKEINGNVDVEINEVKTDSNFVSDGDLFICINGGNFDGHDFVQQAMYYGASAIITERRLQISLPQVVVEDCRIAMSVIASNFYGHPDKKLKLIGVTGTNGKTTTTHIIKKILDLSGIKSGIIGTLGAFYGDKFIEPTLTTPDPLTLYKILKDMLETGVEIVAMEVSAHSLALDKLYGLQFEVAVFTNFTQDHLDYFKTMDEYKKAKLKLFSEFKCKYKVLNADDESYKDFALASRESISYGIFSPSDVFAMDIVDAGDRSKFILNLFDCVYDVELKLKGEFNVYNALAAVTAVSVVGIRVDDAVYGLENISVVSGRMERIYSNGFSVYVDYAHTPDGLKKALTTLKTPENRLVCVFGCGGNRDKTKRKTMGEISGQFADFTIITSDNPRFEEPMDIIYEIEDGIAKVNKNYVAIQDRLQAIEYAINHARNGDVILVAGKGSENYQDILGIKHVFKDKDIIEEIIRGRRSD
ncbi:MAG: UDP-N-acetylmuramoyl-L-alanyl-D-glutamate--2,6-diaminopimelate ligase [Clostridiales bacterium]|nr:UDP-N-acetylmuramoyl-L-alanyl-D-glutamate--2,6-diaminopimelate ligase [Clostridiales bacterium]